MDNNTVVGIRFDENGDIINYSAGGLRLDAGMSVVAETSRGADLGRVVTAPKKMESGALKKVLRIATERDLRTAVINKQREKELFKVFSKKIEEYKLDMKPINAECSFEGGKIMFYFTAENRVDFRVLVKDLAGMYRCRIELRQVGVRDEARLLGGLGICGRQFCCKTFLSGFQPVSIRMAKEQSLSLNPAKTSGTCGRLMCCLKYEQSTYEELLRITPKVGAIVEIPEGQGCVEEVNTLTGVMKVKMGKNKNDNDAPSVTTHRDKAKIIKDGKIQLKREEIEAFKSLE